MSGEGETGTFPVDADRQPCSLTAQGLAPFTDKESVRFRLRPRADRQPCFYETDLVGAEWVCRRQPSFEPGNMQDAVLNIYLRHLETAGLRYAQAVTEHQQQQAAIADSIPAVFGCGNKFVHFCGNQVFSILHHFVQCFEILIAPEGPSFLNADFGY